MDRSNRITNAANDPPKITGYTVLLWPNQCVRSLVTLLTELYVA